jgi:L-cysteine S-thiosulfotransferase
MKVSPSKSPSLSMLRELIGRRVALVLLPAVFAASWAASFALAQVGADKTGADKRRSGYQDMGAALQKMQDDDTANPGMLFVQLGQQLWAKPAGAVNKSCADWHSVADMKGVAARYPAMSKDGDKPIDLEGRIRLCRTANQQAEPSAPESRDLLALMAFVANQSRGLPIAPPDDPRLTPFRDQGAAIWARRQGQLNLSCSICHDDNAGKKLAGVTIPEAHPTGYPIYRLEWQALGSLKRRLRNCLVGVRAEAYPYEALEYVALEVFLMDRAKGMIFESPGVRP